MLLTSFACRDPNASDSQSMPAADSLLLQGPNVEENVVLIKVIKVSDCFCADTIDSALRDLDQFFLGGRGGSKTAFPVV